MLFYYLNKILLFVSFQLSKHTAVCSDHFVKDQDFIKKGFCSRRYLKDQAVPSVFHWTKAVTERRSRKADTGNLSQ